MGIFATQMSASEVVVELFYAAFFYVMLLNELNFRGLYAKVLVIVFIEPFHVTAN